MKSKEKDHDKLLGAWRELHDSFPANFFVTLAYNPCIPGTASWCYRRTPDDTLLRLPTDNVPVAAGVNKLPTVRRVALEQVHQECDRLHRDIDRKLFGSHYNKRVGRDRCSFIGMVEHEVTNVHVHLLWNTPESRTGEFADLAIARWKSFGQYRSANVQAIRDGGAAQYACKDWKNLVQEDEPLLFVASRAILST